MTMTQPAILRAFAGFTVALAATTGALAQTQSPSQAQSRTQEDCSQAINFEEADIRSIVDEIAMRTGKKFVLDPRVQGRVTIKSGPNGGVCPGEAWELFQAALRVIGFAATPINADSYRIVPLQEGSRAPGPVGAASERGSIVTQIVRLNNIDAREAAANLAQLVSERGVVAPVRSGNSIILVDTSDNVARLREVLSQIDRDTTVYRTVALNFASATAVAKILEGLAQEITDEGGGGKKASVVPVEASNSILIRAEPSIVSRLVSVVAELDRIGETKGDLSVIRLNHANAEDLATLLREIATTQPATTGAEGASASRSRANVSFHNPTNSIIISGDADIQKTLRSVIDQLDVRRAQVLIEAIIVEVSDTTARNLGIQYFITGTGGSRVPFSTTNFASAQPNILAAAGSLLLQQDGVPSDFQSQSGAVAQAALTSLLGINGFALGGAGALGDNSVFGGILTALKEDTQSNVLSFPSVVTLDNQAATLSVGQEIPITTGEAVGDNFSNAFRTVSREEVGVILEVTPQINEGGTVTLLIRQETSSVEGQIIATSTDLITNKRVISTTTLVDDGDILVIGGLVDQSTERQESKVPFLGDLPVAGNLFKTQAKSRDRRNLMVFIRPTILRDRDSAGAATQKKLDYIRARELLSTGRPVSELEALIEQVTGVNGAGAAPQ